MMLQNIERQLEEMAILENIKRSYTLGNTICKRDLQVVMLLLVIFIGSAHILCPVTGKVGQSSFQSVDYCALVTLSAFASACEVYQPDAHTSKDQQETGVQDAVLRQEHVDQRLSRCQIIQHPND